MTFGEWHKARFGHYPDSHTSYMYSMRDMYDAYTAGVEHVKGGEADELSSSDDDSGEGDNEESGDNTPVSGAGDSL